jgi:hypothetical protein
LGTAFSWALGGLKTLAQANPALAWIVHVVHLLSQGQTHLDADLCPLQKPQSMPVHLRLASKVRLLTSRHRLQKGQASQKTCGRSSEIWRAVLDL